MGWLHLKAIHPVRGRLPALAVDLTIPLGFVTKFGSRLFNSGLNVALDFPKLANAAAVKKTSKKTQRKSYEVAIMLSSV